MSSLAQVATALHHVVTTVADTAARSTGCIQRTRCFTGASWVQTLVFGCLGTPEPSLTDLCQTAAILGVAVSPQAIAQRFTQRATACLAQVLTAAVETVITADPVAIPLLRRFPGVYLLDTSTVPLPPALAETWPSCGNGQHQPAAALKLGVRLDLLHGTLTGPLLDTGRADDRQCAVTAAPLPAGALRIADLGFWSVTDLARLTAAKVYWLARLQAQTGVFDADGTRLDLDHLLATTPDDEVVRDVRLGTRTQVPARLLAQRVPPDVARQRRRRMRADGKRRGVRPQQNRLRRCDWLLLVTNVEAARLTLAEAVVLQRARWQIELLFKLWKAHGHIDDVRSADPWRVLSELYAKLIAMVIQHWTLLLGCWQFTNRSLVRAAATVRRHALRLLDALGSVRQLNRALATVIAAVAVAGRQNRRRAKPNLSQLLLAGDTGP